MRVVDTLLAAGLVISSTWVNAGVVIGGTRLIYDGAKPESTITVKNPDTFPYLIQSWVNTEEEGKDKVKAPFIITPPLFRLDGGKENTLRVVKTATSLPQDKESIFWLSVKSVPPTDSEHKGNMLQIAIRSKIKLIYRPAKLPGNLLTAAKALQWKRDGNTLQAVNNSPYYLSFYAIKAAGNVIKEPKMVAPGSIIDYTLPAESKGNQIAWQVIDDFGGISETYQRNL